MPVRIFSSSSGSSSTGKGDENEDNQSSDSEPGPSKTAEPKSAIDVALELIEQEEIEAINAARIAALNKPKPRGRPPLARKSSEAAEIANGKHNSSNMSNRKTKDLQDEVNFVMKHQFSEVPGNNDKVYNSTDISSSLQETGDSVPSPARPPILLDHLEIEAAARAAPLAIEVSLFGSDNGEPNSIDFHKMVLLNYGSVDGRLEDDNNDGLDEESERDQNTGSSNARVAHKEFNPMNCPRSNNEQVQNAQSCTETDTAPTHLLCTPSSNGTVESKLDNVAVVVMETDKPKEPVPAPINKISPAIEKRSRGRPRKNFTPPTKIRKPRGRPRKDGAVSVPKAERKIIERRYSERYQKPRPRRAAAMIQDFLEMYTKVDLSDLEYIHARATTFVKMLVDEYIEENKPKNKPRNAVHRSKGKRTKSSSFNAGQKGSCDSSDSRHNLSKRISSEDMDTPAGHKVLEGSAEEMDSSGEDLSPDGDYESNSDTKGEFGDESTVDDRSFTLKELTESFIDAIPVIRGTVLQPAVIDSA